MDLKRLLHLLRASWIWLILAALLGVGAGLAIVSPMNEGRQPTHRAVARVVFLPEPESSMEDRLENGRRLAEQANEAVMIDGQEEILVDPLGDRLLFSAQRGSREEAESTAISMRDRFLEAASPAAENRLATESLEILREQIDVVGAQLSSIPDTGSFEAERQFLNAQIDALGERVGELSLELALLDRNDQGDEERQQEIETELDGIRAILVDLEDDLAALPEEADPFSAEELTRLTLQRHYNELVDRYQALYLKNAALDPFLVVGETSMSEVTPPKISREMAGLVGLVAGLLLAALILIARDRITEPVWSRGDLAPNLVLGELPPRWPGVGSEQLWYPRAPVSPRKSGIQVLRAVVEGTQASGSSVVALTGVDTGSQQVHALAGDLAVSLAVSGRSVILIDADLEKPASLPEFTSPGPTVSEILLSPVDEEEGLALVKQAVHDRPDRYFNLRVLPAGSGIVDVADALAIRLFSHLLAEARGDADLVIVAGPDALHPGTDSLSQRVDEMIVIGETGRTAKADVNFFLQELGGRRAHLLGMVLLKGAPEGRPRLWKRFRDSPTTGTGSSDHPGRHKRPPPSDKSNSVQTHQQSSSSDS